MHLNDIYNVQPGQYIVVFTKHKQFNDGWGFHQVHPYANFTSLPRDARGWTYSVLELPPTEPHNF